MAINGQCDTVLKPLNLDDLRAAFKTMGLLKPTNCQVQEPYTRYGLFSASSSVDYTGEVDAPELA